MANRRFNLTAFVGYISALPLLIAQSEKAQVTGTVVDSSGARVPGVDITLTNTATGESRATASNETGSYTIPLLEPGSYEIGAQKASFRRTKQTAYSCM